jgi:hypothetical protein
MPVYLLIEGCALSVAIWEHNKIVTTVAMTTWMLNLAACIHSVSVSQRTWIQLKLGSGVATCRAAWIENLQICAVLDLSKTKFNMICITATEIVLLTLMLSGLMRWKNRGKGSLWHVLFTQVSPSRVHVLH